MQVPQGDTYHIIFTTRAFATGIPGTLSAATVAVYEEATATPIQTSVAVTEDYNSITGLNHVPIVATSGNGYDVGSYYSVVIEAGTVDSVSVVGEVIGHFRCMAAEGVAGVPDANTTHVGDTVQTALDINDILDDTAAMQPLVAKIPLSDGTISWNATALAAINAEADTALSDYDPPTKTEMDTAFTEIKGATWASGTDTLEHIRNKQTDIETDTAEIGTAGAGLTDLGGSSNNWNVGKTGYSLTATTGLGAQTANITGNLSGSVGSVTGAVGSVTGAVGSVAGNVDGNVSGSVASNLELGPAEVNAEVVDVLFTDTDAEPAQGAPAATTTLADKIGFLYKAWRNKSTQTATTYSLFNDDTSTVDHKATVSDDATTATKGEVATGP